MWEEHDNDHTAGVCDMQNMSTPDGKTPIHSTPKKGKGLEASCQYCRKAFGKKSN